MMKIKVLIKKMYRFFFRKKDKRELLNTPEWDKLPEDEQLSIWRSLGIKIGNNCHIYSKLPIGRDCFLLEIGNNVTITHTTFLTHDASVGNATNMKYTDILGKIVISDNCFTGYGTIILPGVFLAKGIIVGSGSVVTRSFKEENIVIAGNPAKKICTVKDFLNKNSVHMLNLNGLKKKDLLDYISKNPNVLRQR